MRASKRIDTNQPTRRRPMSLLNTTVKQIQAMVGVRLDGVFGPVTGAAVLAALEAHHRQTRVTPKESENFGFDARTERYLSTLAPVAQRNFRRFTAQAQATAAAMGTDYVMISGARTMAKQRELYRKWKAGTGGKAAAPGFSDHNFGIAGDYGVFRGGRYLDGSKVAEERKLALAVHRAVAANAASYGLYWGGNWKGRSNDPPHFGLMTRMSMAEKRRAMSAGKELE